MNPNLKMWFAVTFASAAIPLALGVVATLLAVHGIVVSPFGGDPIGVGPH
jgi:hypothetical protein